MVHDNAAGAGGLAVFDNRDDSPGLGRDRVGFQGSRHGTVEMMAKSFLGAGLTCAAFAMAGCSPPLGLSAYSAQYPLEGACPEDGAAGGLEFINEISKLQLRITGPGIADALVTEGGLDTLTLDEVPAGENRTVSLYGIGVDGAATWRGTQTGVTVAADQTTSVEVLLSRIADLSCPRTPLSSRRSFHSVTTLQDGRLLLIGGASTEADASNQCGSDCAILTATRGAEIYDPATGEFSPTGDLEVPRMFHTATLLGDGRVVVVGGVGESQINPVDENHAFPIMPRVAPTSTMEVWDPARGVFTSIGADPAGPRVYHASAVTPEGYLIVTGGIASAGTNDLSNALRAVTLCEGNSLVCVSNLQMQQPRAGHTLVPLENGDVLAWGGSVVTEAVLGIPGYKPEVYRGGVFQMIDTAGFSSNLLNPFFAATTRYSGSRVASAGGLVRNPDGSFSMAAVQKAGTTRGPVYVFDGTPTDGNGAVSAGPYVPDGAGGEVLDALVISEPRFFGGAAALPGNRAVFAGGFASLTTLEPSPALEIYGESPFAVAPLTVGGQPRLLRQARGGLSAVGLGDGTVLFSGGSERTSGVRRPLGNAEIFADPQDPGEFP